MSILLPYVLRYCCTYYQYYYLYWYCYSPAYRSEATMKQNRKEKKNSVCQIERTLCSTSFRCPPFDMVFATEHRRSISKTVYFFDCRFAMYYRKVLSSAVLAVASETRLEGSVAIASHVLVPAVHA